MAHNLRHSCNYRLRRIVIVQSLYRIYNYPLAEDTPIPPNELQFEDNVRQVRQQERGSLRHLA